MKKASLFFLVVTIVALAALISWKPDQGKIVWLSSLDLSKMSQNSDKPKINENAVGKPFSISKQIFSKGVGTSARSYVWIDLGGTAEKFSAYVGIDDDTKNLASTISQNFKVLGDNKSLWESGPMHYGDKAKKVQVSLKGVKTLILVVVNTTINSNILQADWADAHFLVRGLAPKAIDPHVEPKVIYTPKPGSEPKINGPKIYGCRPRNPFLYRIPATGKRPMIFAAEKLPKGLMLDQTTGIITGAVKDRGEFIVKLTAKNNKGNDYIHAKGLKTGIYSSPGPLTCATYTGSYNYEAQDAKQFATWGFDLLKYDWCSYGKVESSTTDEARQKPYRLMGSLVQQQKRDIVFNICQYGMNSVWKWGAEVGGNSWRTGGDLGYRLKKLFEVAQKNAEYGSYSGPGGWNDPDYIQIGYLGNSPTKLTPNEQYAFMSLWCLLPAPLVYSGQINKMDAFTLNILCNPEVIDVNQDALGKPGKIITNSDESFIMVKDLEDGSKAVGLCNSGEIPTKVTFSFSDAGLSGKQTVRNLWKQKDIGLFLDKFTTTVPRHGVVLVRIMKTKR